MLDPAAAELREWARGPMESLVERVGESANLVVLAGTEVRFVATVECNRVLRVGDRAGQRLPAHLTSGGKAILAQLPDAELNRFVELGPTALAKLRHDIHAARLAGYASNRQDTEKGLTAIGVALAPLPGSIRAAICLAMPTARYRNSSLETNLSALRDAARAIEVAIDAAGSTSSGGQPTPSVADMR